MMFKGLILGLVLINLTTPVYAETQGLEESDQQINDFSLAGYAEKGKKSWDLAGKSADIFTEVIKLKDVVGNLYGKDEDIKLTAEKGDFNKVSGLVHLEENVIITTSSGSKLTTDSLDWDRQNQLVSTNDTVNIERQNMVTVARGAKGEPNLKKVALEKDVRVDINPEEASGVKEKTVITCDGPLEIDYGDNVATFNNNVKVERPDSVIYSDTMEVYFKSDKAAQAMANKIERIKARGNVKVLRGENTSYSEEASYSASDKKLILSGNPRLVIYSNEELSSAPSGN